MVCASFAENFPAISKQAHFVGLLLKFQTGLQRWRRFDGQSGFVSFHAPIRAAQVGNRKEDFPIVGCPVIDPRYRVRIGFLECVEKDQVKDVFDGYERLEPSDRNLAYVAAQLARFDFLSTDTDAKGLAFEAITSHTLKQKKGQFFTPRNVIRMMVEMVDPQPGKRVLDPACGSGGFLIVALNHARRRFLNEVGCLHPNDPVPSERKKADPLVKRYARESLFGIDVDSDLRKAARMNVQLLSTPALAPVFPCGFENRLPTNEQRSRCRTPQTCHFGVNPSMAILI